MNTAIADEVSDELTCLGEHNVASTMAMFCNYPLDAVLQAAPCVDQLFAGYQDDSAAFREKSDQMIAWKHDYFDTHNIAVPISGDALCNRAEQEIADRSVIGRYLGADE